MPKAPEEKQLHCSPMRIPCCGAILAVRDGVADPPEATSHPPTPKSIAPSRNRPATSASVMWLGWASVRESPPEIDTATALRRRASGQLALVVLRCALD